MSKFRNRMANIVHPDETARNWPSHLEVHGLHRYLFWSVRLKASPVNKTNELYKINASEYLKTVEYKQPKML